MKKQNVRNKYKGKPLSIFEFLFDEDIPSSERMYVLAFSLSIFGILAMAFVGLYTSPGDYVSFFGMLGVALILGLMTVAGLAAKKIYMATMIIVMLVVFILFPALFFFDGGYKGGIIGWNLFGLTYIMVLLEGRSRIILAVTDLIIITVCYAVAWINPSSCVYYAKDEYAICDSYVSFLIAGSFLAVLILYQNALIRRQRDKAIEQVEEIENLNASQNNFFSNMSHEIRTPINTIIGLNEMTLREVNVSDEAIENAMNIESASKMLLSLINDILDMSKIQSGKMDIVPAQYESSALISDVINMVYVKAKEKGLELKVTVDKNLPTILLCDDVRLRQVLINIMNNAVKYTKEGSVSLNVRCEIKTDNIAHVVYSVSDTGIGIRKENIPHLFDSFKRVDQDKNRFIEGTGLGLSICKQLAELLGAKLSVDSVYTKGSTFHFELDQVIIDSTPIGEVDFIVASKAMRNQKYHQSFEAPTARVLVVDDNEMNRTVATKLLRDTKVMIDTADSGESALDLCQKNFYNIIFMDHMMPQMDGIECTYKIRHQTGGLNTDTVILALTANVRTDSDEFYQNAGMNGYLSKPISGTMLEAAMIKYLPREIITYIDLKSDAIQRSVLDSDRIYKKKCIISTLSSCDLTDEMLDEHGIRIIPYTIATPYGQFLDREEIGGDQLYDYVKKTGERIEIMAPTVEEFEKYFAVLLEDCDEVIHFSSMISPQGLENARKAAASFGSIHIVETSQFSGGLGLLSMLAAMLIKNGMTVHDTVETCRGYIENLESRIIISRAAENLVALGFSKRYLGVRNMMLQRPALLSKGHASRQLNRYFGAYSVNIDRFIKDALKKRDDIDKRFLVISYSALSVEELDNFIQTVKKYCDFENILVLKCSAANVSIISNRAVGLFYLLKP